MFKISRPYIIANTRELRDKMKKLCPEAKVLGRADKLREFINNNALIIKVFGGARNNSLHSLEIKRKCIEHDGSILLMFSENEENENFNENFLESLKCFNEISGYIYERDFNVPLNLKIGIALDRLIGKR